MSSPCEGCAHARPAAEHWQPKFSIRCGKFAPDELPPETWWEVKFKIYLAANETGRFTYHGREVKFVRDALQYGWAQFPDRYNPEHVLACQFREGA